MANKDVGKETKLNAGKLAALIERRGMSLGQMAIYVGISRSHLSLIINGHRTNVTISSIARLAVFLGVSVDYLLDLTDDPTPVSKKDLPPALRRLWETYRQLSPLNQAILSYLAGLAAIGQEKNMAISADEILVAGLEALERELGPVGMIRFLQLFETDSGDYTIDRHAWQDSMTVEQIVALIKKQDQN